MMLLPKYNHALGAVVIASVLAAGCGGPAAPEFPQVDVSGKVTMDGEPLTGVSVYFANKAGAGGRAFNLKDDGTFVGDKPLTVAEYQVWISQKKETPGASGPPVSELDKVPDAYRSGETSGLTAMVTEDGENYFEFELSSSKSGGDSGMGGDVKGATKIMSKQ